MNAFMFTCALFLVLSVYDIFKMLFFAFAHVLFGWPEGLALEAMNCEFWFSGLVICVFLAMSVSPILDEMIIDAIDYITGQLVRSQFYRNLM